MVQIKLRRKYGEDICCDVIREHDALEMVVFYGEVVALNEPRTFNMCESVTHNICKFRITSPQISP